MTRWPAICCSESPDLLPDAGLLAVVLGAVLGRGAAGLWPAESEPFDAGDENGKLPAAALAMKNTTRPSTTRAAPIRTQDSDLRTAASPRAAHRDRPQ